MTLHELLEWFHQEDTNFIENVPNLRHLAFTSITQLTAFKNVNLLPGSLIIITEYIDNLLIKQDQQDLKNATFLVLLSQQSRLDINRLKAWCKQEDINLLFMEKNIENLDRINQLLALDAMSLHEENKLAKYAFKVFSDLIIDNPSLSDFVQKLSEKIKQPLIIANTHHQTIVSTHDKYTKLLYGESYLIGHDTCMDKNLHFECDGQMIVCEGTIYMINHANQLGYYMAIIKRRPLDQKNHFLLTMCLPYLALLIKHHILLGQMKSRCQSEDISNIIKQISDDNYPSSQEVIHLAKSANWKITSPLIPVKLEWKKTNPHEDETIFTFKSRLQIIFPNYTIAPCTESSLLLLIPLLGHDDKILHQEITSISAYLARSFKELDILIGVGTRITSIDMLKTKIEEAKEAIAFAKLFPQNASTVYYKDLGINRFLCLYDSSEEVSKLIPSSLKKLKDYDAQKNTDFIETLQAYFKHNGNINQVAQDLYLHYKTVAYRMNRIKELMGTDFKDTKERLSIEVGLEIMTLTRD